jgi:hypothetical protein
MDHLKTKFVWYFHICSSKKIVIFDSEILKRADKIALSARRANTFGNRVLFFWNKRIK